MHEGEGERQRKEREENAREREEKIGDPRKRRSGKICATEIFRRMREKEKREERSKEKGGWKKTFIPSSRAQ